VLLEEIEPGRSYPYQFVCYRVTDFRPESHRDLVIPGCELAHDLALFIEALVGTVPAEQPQQPELVTLEQLSQRLNVSTKTIRRWGKLGLVGQQVTRDGKRQVCYSEEVIERFLATNQERVARGGKFSHLSDAEREDVLKRAKRLARAAGATLTEISRRIAKRLGRSAETVRYTIKNHDRDNPDEALFPEMTGPMDTTTKESIYSSYRRGIDVETLAKKYNKTRTSVYRAINEVRARHLLEQPLDYISHPDFDKPENDALFLGPMPRHEEYEAKKRAMHAPRDVPPELASCYEYPLLDREQEAHLFRQMNYLKHKAARLRAEMRKDDGDVDPSRVRVETLREIEELQEKANAVKEMLINANMRLVVNIAKRHGNQAP
jgi:RNA polymerase primary sigma factor